MIRRAARLPFALFALASLGPVAAAAPAAAQQQEFEGVNLGLVYENAYVPALGIQQFSGRLGGGAIASQVQAIVAQDLEFSDRFAILDDLPINVTAEEVDYSLWDGLNATWVLKGRIEGAGTNEFVLVLELHDVLYRRVEESGRFPLPNHETDNPGFRMAVHRASDQVVEWVFDEPGMAASRISFAMRRNDGTKEVYIVDSDGENLTRLTSHGNVANSPVWAPDNRRIAYMTYDNDGQRIYERNLETGETKRIEALRDGNYMTPTYYPDGENMVFSVHTGSRSGLFTYDAARECCLTNLTESPADDFSPTISPDGRWMAFNSTRLGSAIPQVYVMEARAGARPELLSPYQYGQSSFFSAPDWSPDGENIAFSGRYQRSGRYHILVAKMGEGRRLLQLTFEGNNEAPSWAPDGRHIVFTGEHRWGKGLFVVDSASGTIRPILTGVDVADPDWSGGM
jgi:TolB protein